VDFSLFEPDTLHSILFTQPQCHCEQFSCACLGDQCAPSPQYPRAGNRRYVISASARGTVCRRMILLQRVVHSSRVMDHLPILNLLRRHLHSTLSPFPFHPSKALFTSATPDMNVVLVEPGNVMPGSFARRLLRRCIGRVRGTPQPPSKPATWPRSPYCPLPT
jgi:hypothetical protein